MREHFLGIGQEEVDAADSHVVLTVSDERALDDLAHFVRGVNARLGKEQPELRAYLGVSGNRLGLEDWLAYGAGAALTYDMVPDFHRREPLTVELIDALHQSMVEQEEVVVGGGGELKGQLHLSDFVEKLQKDSPAFMGWLGGIIDGLERDKDKSDFILGSLIVAMAFYMRAESRFLAASFMGEM